MVTSICSTGSVTVLVCLCPPQVHVLTFTVHLLLQSLASRLQVGDLDACLDILIEVRFLGEMQCMAAPAQRSMCWRVLACPDVS